jgi:hypothetical protein
MRAKAKLSGDSVGAPSIRTARGEVEIDQRNEQDAQGNVTGRRSGHVVGLRRYLARGEIVSRQFEAGTRWAADCEQSQRIGLGAVDPGSVTGGGDQASHMIHVASEARAAGARFDAGKRHLGPLYPLLARVVLANGSPSEWARARGYRDEHGFGCLMLGLDTLATVYEIE